VDPARRRRGNPGIVHPTSPQSRRDVRTEPIFIVSEGTASHARLQLFLFRRRHFHRSEWVQPVPAYHENSRIEGYGFSPYIAPHPHDRALAPRGIDPRPISVVTGGTPSMSDCAYTPPTIGQLTSFAPRLKHGAHRDQRQHANPADARHLKKMPRPSRPLAFLAIP
jgi:hypothetical protein